MERLEFIKRMFDFFQIKNDGKGALLENYDIALSVNYKVDWDNLYFYIIKHAEKNIRPMPKAILGIMPRFKKLDISAVEGEGDTIIVLFADGRRSDFVVCAWADTSVKDIIAKNWIQGADGRFTNRVKKIVQIPKGIYVPYGSSKIFFNEDISEQKQKILKSKIKVLWNNKKYMKGTAAV